MDPDEERQFLAEFTRAGRRAAIYASSAGALLFLAFLGIAWAWEPHSKAALYVRAFLVLSLGACALFLSLKEDITRRAYVWVLGSTTVLALGGTLLLQVMPAGSGRAVAVYASPAIMFGLFLHYAFLRLPLSVSAAIGWTIGAASVVWSPAVTGGSAMLRNALYLAFANAFGMIFAMLVERRERELFYQRRLAEAARTESHVRRLAAEEAVCQKTRLIAAVSHDLRQPMAAAVAYLEVALSRLGKGDVTGGMSSADKARAAVNVLGSTLDQLLTAARYDSGTEAIQIRSVDLAEALRAVHSTNAAEADARGVRFDVRLPRHRIVLHTDARAIQRVLSNLVSNGIKFTDPMNRSNSRVMILARMRGATCRIDVIDTGIGIEASQSEVIWEPYVQLNNVERDRDRGLGLGLFLVKQILQQLPGHMIEMRSKPGHGTRFSVNVPAMKLMQPKEEDKVARTTGYMLDLRLLRGAYVLLLEDDRDARLSLEALLCEWGGVVSSAATLAGLLAAEDEAERLVDVLVFDYRLSGGSNGLDAIARVRDRLGYSPHAILMTGEADIAPLVERAGPDTTVLQKPFAPEALAEPLLRAVRAARALEED